MKKRFHVYFVYLSVACLVVFLYQNHYLRIPIIQHAEYLIASILFLFAGFLSNAFCWKKYLSKAGYPVNFKQSVSASGLSVFGKYIPGKVWTIVGRAVYLAERTPYSWKELSSLSLNAQFLSLWAGLTVGIAGLFILKKGHVWGWPIFLLWLLLSGIVFSPIVHRTTEKIIRFFIKRKIVLPSPSGWSAVSLLPWFVLDWFLWGVGFYLFVWSLSDIAPDFSVVFGFAHAATLGILSVFAPGGLGVREGILVGYLGFSGISILDATTISVSARLWFLEGELFLFLLGWIFHRKATTTRN